MPAKRRSEGDDPPVSLDATLEFMRELWAVHHGLQARSKRMAVRLGVTGPQRLVVRIVGTRPAISAGELADVLHVHPSTISGVLRRLEKQGLVARRAASHDRRRAELTLTDKGRRVDELRGGTVEAAVRQVLEGAAPGDIASTREILSRLARALEAEEP
jgi:DNA-binding MarR family transcriptional regulator